MSRALLFTAANTINSRGVQQVRAHIRGNRRQPLRLVLDVTVMYLPGRVYGDSVTESLVCYSLFGCGGGQQNVRLEAVGNETCERMRVIVQ